MAYYKFETSETFLISLPSHKKSHPGFLILNQGGHFMKMRKDS